MCGPLDGIGAGVSQTDRILSLYRTHRGELVNYAASITGDRAAAEDVVQEAWTRIGAAARLRPLEEPAGYLYRIVRNLALDGRRRSRFEQRHFVEGLDAEAVRMPGDSPTPEATAFSKDELRLVLEVLEGLPERTRIAVEMHRLGGAKLKEIAARLGVSVTVAHELVADGVERCRARLRRAG
ncbi:sigma-70 family RNA polymerase sigma factor [Sandaracinobacter sp. RS1-74]|uniref:sigma-70 family RNA polymerase sigma factor n=1 Tax=Sandaracinobacteroides sayramensis TaxID=2913411 RepID=UPI001EDB0F65|nr:sigma-70 family RNA polymerase sigma factor [Sandaracinobacteroides sayramensis]MCG2842088.1 sigma-70 family RNA polymerase sigma factor [Sandaracinobacteroides sayramensis]